MDKRKKSRILWDGFDCFDFVSDFLYDMYKYDSEEDDDIPIKKREDKVADLGWRFVSEWEKFRNLVQELCIALEELEKLKEKKGDSPDEYL